MKTVLPEIVPLNGDHIAALIDNWWRYDLPGCRHSMACGDGRRCGRQGDLILRFVQEAVPCPTCDGTFVAKRGSEKGYSCSCYTGYVLGKKR